jgi:putative ABC transport system permease protein
MPNLAALPGVDAVALSSPPPFAGGDRKAITFEGVTGPTTLTPVRAVSASYFPIVGLRLLKGRIFTETESRTAAPVMPIVVSASFASTFFPGVEAIGRRIRFGNDDAAQIVGVVNDTVSIRPTERDEPMVYQPMYAANVASVTAVVRLGGDARPLMEAIRARVREIDSRLQARPETVAHTISSEADRYTAVVKTTALPAGVALFLSIVGVYGLSTFAAAHRTHEIGVRIALGARTRDIVTLFLHSLRRPFIVGVLGGCVLSAAGVLLLQRTRVMTDVSLRDPLTFGAAIALLLITAVGATLIPSFRAARKAPAATLRAS